MNEIALYWAQVRESVRRGGQMFTPRFGHQAENAPTFTVVDQALQKKKTPFRGQAVSRAVAKKVKIIEDVPKDKRILANVLGPAVDGNNEEEEEEEEEYRISDDEPLVPIIDRKKSDKRSDKVSGKKQIDKEISSAINDLVADEIDSVANNVVADDEAKASSSKNKKDVVDYEDEEEEIALERLKRETGFSAEDIDDIKRNARKAFHPRLTTLLNSYDIKVTSDPTFTRGKLSVDRMNRVDEIVSLVNKLKDGSSKEKISKVVKQNLLTTDGYLLNIDQLNRRKSNLEEDIKIAMELKDEENAPILTPLTKDQKTGFHKALKEILKDDGLEFEEGNFIEGRLTKGRVNLVRSIVWYVKHLNQEKDKSEVTKAIKESLVNPRSPQSLRDWDSLHRTLVILKGKMPKADLKKTGT